MANDTDPEVDTELKTLDLGFEGVLETLSMGQRIIGLKAVPYDTVADSRYGKLMFKQGAFGEIDPTEIRLRMDHEDPPTGLGKAVTDAPDGLHIDFKVSKTSRGDDQLTLARDGVSRGASVGFADVLGGPSLEKVNGEFVTVYGPNTARLAEVSTTWQPTFEGAGVTHMLKKNEEDPELDPQATQETKELAGPPAPVTVIQDTKHFDQSVEKMLGKFEEWQESMRRNVSVPGVTSTEVRRPKPYAFVQVALQMMRGQAVAPAVLKALALDDVITSENPGLVPDVLVRDFDDLIRTGRPFIESLRQIAAPTTGMSLIVPTITQRAVTGTQSAEKADITGTTAPKVGTITFPYLQVFGGADVAIQMLNRGDASFFDLLTQLLAEAYALDAEGKALDALLDPQGAISGGGSQSAPVDGGVLDPEDPHFGQAWENAITAYRRAPDTIWMDAAAVAAFIDAKSPVTNAPLYSNLAAAFTAGNGPGGVLSGLRPIYVPAMDESDVDVIVGPSQSYVVAEDPARNLQVDVPSKAGKDVALVGGLFFGPRAPEAFTTYTIGS
jgi:HK97 family phage major capsid protein